MEAYAQDYKRLTPVCGEQTQWVAWRKEAWRLTPVCGEQTLDPNEKNLLSPPPIPSSSELSRSPLALEAYLPEVPPTF